MRRHALARQKGPHSGVAERTSPARSFLGSALPSRESSCFELEVPSPGKINRIPTFLPQNPAARAGPRLSYTKPETVRRDGSNEVTWAFNESLSALLFTHHRFLLNRSIAAGRARARPIRKFALLDRWISWLLERFSMANPPRILRACCSSVLGLGKCYRAPAS